jgi:putative DNA primase/helicase
VFRLRRKTKDETVAKLRQADRATFKPLISKLARFAEDYGYQVQQARPVMPDQLSDRAADNWEPLYAIASSAGPEWLARAEQAALAMSGKTEGADSLGPELLTDVQTVFTTKKVFKLRSAELLEALNADAEMAWPTYNRGGNPLTVRQLAKPLSGYGIRTRTVRIDKHKTYKGYYKEDFADAFARYLTENDPDLRHIALEALPTEAVAVSDAKTGIRNLPDDPDREALLTEIDELADALEAEVADTRPALPALGRSGDSDVSGKEGDAGEAF